MSTVKKICGYWVDQNGNRWEAAIYSKKEAEESGLESSKNCTNCFHSEYLENCIDCNDCDDCSYCVECTDCQKSSNLNNCTGCVSCVNCDCLEDQRGKKNKVVCILTNRLINKGK